jgi:hypothetical protein
MPFWRLTYPVISIPPTLSVRYAVKGASARPFGFHWPIGFGVFTFGQKGLLLAAAYEKNHHAQHTTFGGLARWGDEYPASMREAAGKYRVGDANLANDPGIRYRGINSPAGEGKPPERFLFSSPRMYWGSHR